MRVGGNRFVTLRSGVRSSPRETVPPALIQPLHDGRNAAFSASRRCLVSVGTAKTAPTKGSPARGRAHVTAVVATDADGDVLARQVFRLTPPDEVRRPVRLPDGQLAHRRSRGLKNQASPFVG